MASVAIAESRTELAARIDAIGREARRLPLGELCRRVDGLRNLATARRLLPLARLAGGLRDTLAEDGRGAPVAPWLAAMRESLHAEIQDEAAARAFVASVGVRLVG